MAANFWTSSHKEWLLSKEELQHNRSKLLERISYKEFVKLEIYYSTVIHKLARSIAHILHIPTRQQVIATSVVYFKRFYTKNRLDQTDPLLVSATCYYLASKTEESPVHIKTLVNEMKQLYNFPYEPMHISEFEFYILIDLDYHTIVYHPYRTLHLFIQQLRLEKTILQTSSFLLNDMYRTDLCLLQPPHILAVTSLYITCICNPNDCNQQEILDFFKALNVDIVIVIESVQELFNLYSTWIEYSDDQISDILYKLGIN